MTKLVEDKRELAQLLMTHAIERVHKLGFRMKVGSKSGTTMKVELGAMNLLFYSTEADGAPVASDNKKEPMSQNIAIADIQVGDFVHWSAPRCPGDNYNLVVGIVPNTAQDLVVLVTGVRKVIPRRNVTAAVRNPSIGSVSGPSPELRP